MARPSRPPPHVGMAVQVMRFGTVEPATVEDVRDEGRTLVVAGERYTLRPVNAHYVLEGEPSYGTRLLLGSGD
jgi:hypothetical protein